MMCDEMRLSTLPLSQRQRGAVERAEAEVLVRELGRGGRHRRCAVVGAYDEAVGSRESSGLVADSAADVDGHTRSEARDDLSIPGVVERKQRIRCRPVQRALARELHVGPAPLPRIQPRKRTARARGTRRGSAACATDNTVRDEDRL